MNIENKLYHYKAHVISVYDGDTFRADIDLGLFTWRNDQIFRLANIDAPEVRGEEYEQGIITRDRLRELMLDKDVIIKTYKDGTGKYGRWIADVYLYDEDGNVDYQTPVTEILLNEGLAERVEY